MAIFSGGFWLGFILGFGGGGALIWFYKSKVQAGVVVTNQIVAQTKAAASTVVSDIKKI